MIAFGLGFGIKSLLELWSSHCKEPELLRRQNVTYLLPFQTSEHVPSNRHDVCLIVGSRLKIEDGRLELM